MIDEIRGLGFKSVELGHNLRFSLLPGVIKSVQEKSIQVISLHNFCPVPIEVLHPSPNCYEFTSSNSSERASAIRSTLQTLEHAAELQAPAVVLHLGSFETKIPVTQKLIHHWKSRSLFTKKTSQLKIDYLLERKKQFPVLQKRLHECLKPILEKATELKIKLGIEFRSDLEEFPHADEFDWLFREYAGSPLHYWHDFGHAGLMDSLGMIDHLSFYIQKKPILLGAHWQDFIAPDQDHLALEEGELPLQEFIKETPKNALSVLELSPRIPHEKVQSSLQFWRRNILNLHGLKSQI